jgi:hypothetical protein
VWRLLRGIFQVSLESPSFFSDFINFSFQFPSILELSRPQKSAMGGFHPLWLLSALLLLLPAVKPELTPPYFNLAEGRKISASSTCGLDIDGPELYCKLVGSHTDDQQNKTAFDVHDDPNYQSATLSRGQGHVVIQGQVRLWSGKEKTGDERIRENVEEKEDDDDGKRLQDAAWTNLREISANFSSQVKRLSSINLQKLV